MKIFISSLVVISCAFVFWGCKNNVASDNPTVQPSPLNEKQVDVTIKEPNIEAAKALIPDEDEKGLTFDFLNSLIYLSNNHITKNLKEYDNNWVYFGKSTKSSGHVWENKMYNRAILKMADYEIAYLDYSSRNMDNYNLLMKMKAFQNEDKKLGVSYFNYKDRFVQWRKTDDKGTMINIIDMAGF